MADGATGSGRAKGVIGWGLGGAAGVALVVLGLLFLGPDRPREGGDAGRDAEHTPPGTSTTAPPAEPEGAAAEAEAAPAADRGDRAPKDPGMPEPVTPHFDVVRIAPDGGAVVAGLAEPGAKARVLLEGALGAEALVDAAGNFVAMFTLQPSDVARVLTLEAELADGRVIVSPESLIVEPFALPELVAEAESATAEAGHSPAPAAADGPADTASASAAPDPVQAGEDAVAAAGPVPGEAPRVLRAGPEGVTVMQDALAGGPQLSIDAISYDEAGEVALSGRGMGEGALRIYLDNAPVRSAQVGADGQWRAPLPEVETGVYTLRVDALGPDGAVTGRVETPFMREEPEVLARVGAEAQAAGRPISSITVQPGNTLWAIAKGRYGEGLLYVRIFEANRDQIRNPDLIYPGQVFSLPEAEEMQSPPGRNGERG